MVVALKDKKLANATQQLLACDYLRISTSSNVVGVEVAGALKNVLAIAAGIVDEMNLGNHCKTALVAQGCSEIRWLATKLGAKPATITGISEHFYKQLALNQRELSSSVNRYGLSEGQFSQVLLYEMDAIRKACQSLQEGYLPLATFAVVQKRHNSLP